MSYLILFMDIVILIKHIRDALCRNNYNDCVKHLHNRPISFKIHVPTHYLKILFNIYWPIWDNLGAYGIFSIFFS